MPPRRRQRHYRTASSPQPQLLLALIDLYQLLRTPQPIDSLLQAVLDTAIAYVPGAQRGSLMVLEGEFLRYRAVHGYDLEQLRSVRIPASLVKDLMLRESRAMQVLDFTAWDELYLSAEANHILREHGRVAEIRRSLITAILVGGKFYGSLVLDNLRDHAPFPPAAETLARLLAEQAGALLEQALLIDRLRQTSTMLVEAEKLAALGRFIASIAHEINNPLTAVIGYTDLLADSHIGPDVREMLEQVRVGAERVRTIVRTLQIFARQQKSGAMSVSLNLLVQQSLTLKRGDYALDMIEVYADLAPDLPALWADGGQLSQVLLNLLVNAQHALRQRPPPRQLYLRTGWREGEAGQPARLQLSVRDNGPGIPAALIERIFEPFFTTRLPGQGTGLGLSICVEIIERHGGTIRACSEPGAGAEFIVELPLREGQQAAEPLRPQLQRAPPRGLRILAIDDDPVVQAVIRRTLELGNEVVSASGGTVALGLLAEQSFDLVLCDLKMPEISGEALYRQVAAAQPDVAARFLFISGDTSNAAVRAFLEGSGRPLLAKPFTSSELFEAIAGVVGG